jgi:hypothetical protein
MVQPLTSCCDPKEPSLWVIPHGVLNNITHIPTIKEYVIPTQKIDVAISHIRMRLELGEVFSRRCQWISMVQGSSYDSEGFWDSTQDHGWGSLLLVFYPSEINQDVSRFAEELLVDKYKARDSQISGWVRNMSKS